MKDRNDKELTDEELRILREIAKSEGLTLKEIISNVNVNKDKIAKIFQRLVSEQYIEERIFKNKIDYVIDQKGIDFLKKIKKVV